MPDIVKALLSRHDPISDQVDERELSIILAELTRQVQRPETHGAVVEFGCYVGTTSLFIRRLLDALKPSLSFHVYDSFKGLPEKTHADLSPAGEQFQKGELSASRKAFELQFKKSGLKLPSIHRAWFNQLTPADIPDDICFAYLDGDYYESIRDSLRLIEDKLAADATIVVDDYANEALPGAAKAVDEWVRVHPCVLQVISSLAILRLI